MYSVAYVKDLEQQVAGLQGKSPESTSQVHLESSNPSPGLAEGDIFQEVPVLADPMILSYLPSNSPLTAPGINVDFSLADDTLFSVSQPHLMQRAQDMSATQGSTPLSGGMQPLNRTNMADISIGDGASFFQTYFEMIHPRYPFLDVEECSGAYMIWKTGQLASCNDNGWSMCLVKLVFA
jgi:hypothetical protein